MKMRYTYSAFSNKKKKKKNHNYKQCRDFNNVLKKTLKNWEWRSLGKGGSWREEGIIREKRPRINEVGFNSAGKWQRNTVEDVEHINIHCRKYNSASETASYDAGAKWNMQVLTGQGRQELSGEFGWFCFAVGTEGLDKIIIFIISGIYLTVVSMHEMVLATFECFWQLIVK